MTKEKLKYLLCLYHYRQSNYTVTRLAQELCISKSTLSRVLSNFFQEGLVVAKGKGELTSKGQLMAKKHLDEVNKLQDWLIDEVCLTSDEAYDQALALVLNLSQKAKERLLTFASKEKLFAMIDRVKEISGDMLIANLDEGNYSFGFTIYHHNQARLSVANDGFEHPSNLLIEQGQGHLVFVPKIIKHVSLLSKMVLTGQADILEYEYQGKFIETKKIQGKFYLPIEHLYLYYCQEEKILQGCLKIRITADVSKEHMPPSQAFLHFFFK